MDLLMVGRYRWAAGSRPRLLHPWGKSRRLARTCHAVWGVIADEESLATVEKIVAMPSHTLRPKHHAFLKEKMYFSATLD